MYKSKDDATTGNSSYSQIIAKCIIVRIRISYL